MFCVETIEHISILVRQSMFWVIWSTPVIKLAMLTMQFLLKLCEWQFLALFQTGGYEDQQLAVKHRRAAKAPQALLALQVWAGGASFSPGPPHCRTDVLFSLWPSQWQRQAAGSWANPKHVRSFWDLFNPQKVGSIWETASPSEIKTSLLWGLKL